MSTIKINESSETNHNIVVREIPPEERCDLEYNFEEYKRRKLDLFYKSRSLPCIPRFLRTLE